MQPELIFLGLVLGAIGSTLCVLLHDSRCVIANATKPYSANWRERRQKARVIAEHIGGDEAEAKSWQSIK